MRFLIITTLILLTLSAKSENIDSLISEKLLEQEISFWTEENDSVKFFSLIDKAKIYQSKGLFEDALHELRRAGEYSRRGNQVSLLNYEKMLNYFLSNQYNNAGFITLQREETEQIHKSKEYQTMKLVSLNESGKWEKCKQELLNSCSECDSIEIVTIRELPTTYDFKNPEDCRRFSAFFPGMGQIKAGYPIKALTSFLIQSGLVFFIGYNFYAGFYLTGIVSGSIPLLKFYSGGKKLSAILAEEHNDKEIRKLKRTYSKVITSVTQN